MWGLKRINAENAWKLSTGQGAVVAVLDTGVDYNHPELASQIWHNTLEIPGNEIDDDNNGYVDDYTGWDFVGSNYENNTEDNDVIDGNGHGTHVSGIIAAEKNSEGIVGVAPDAKILPVKVVDDTGCGTADMIAEGIRYAIDMGIRIMSISLGGLGAPSIVIDAIDYAISKGAIIIVAAGNELCDASLCYPAGLNGVVTVAATDYSDKVASFSNFGNTIDVAAPGVDILSLRASGTDMYEDGGQHFVPGGDAAAQYCWANGTSMATPFVSGLAALMLSQEPALTLADFTRRLRFSSVDLGTAGFDYHYGWGRIDAFAALSHDWYDSGAIKTWWLTAPDMNNEIRYVYYEDENVASKWLASADQNNVIRYDYFDSGKIQSKWLFTPDLDNVIRYSFFVSGRIDSKWLNTPDVSGSKRYSYFDEDFNGNPGRSYSEGAVNDFEIYHYSFILGSTKDLMQYDFHHLFNKKSDIGSLRYANWDMVIQPELDKCSVLCANCHISVHVGRYDYLILIPGPIEFYEGKIPYIVTSSSKSQA